MQNNAIKIMLGLLILCTTKIKPFKIHIYLFENFMSIAMEKETEQESKGEREVRVGGES